MRPVLTIGFASAALVALATGVSAQSGDGAAGGPPTDVSRPVGNPTAPANRGRLENQDGNRAPGSGQAASRRDGDPETYENKADDPSLNAGIYRSPKGAKSGTE